MEPLDVAVREQLQCLATTLRDELPTFARDMVKQVVESIGSLADDPDIVDLLLASAEGNLTSVVHILGHDIDLATVDPPLAAVHWARRLAQRGIHITVLVRAYRLGHQSVMNWANSVLTEQTTDAKLVFVTYARLNEMLFRYADRVSEQVIVAYGEEADLWLRSSAAALAARVRGVMRGDPLDVPALEQALGYKLTQHHVGVMLSMRTATGDNAALVELERTAARVADRVTPSARPLFVPRDESSAFVWLGLGAHDAGGYGITDTVELVLGDHVRAAVGRTNFGPEGFRTTMNEALTAHSVVLASGGFGPRLVPFAEVAPISMLTRDSNLARKWVASALGDLAADDDQAAGFRDTLRIYLTTSGSLRETADRLFIHKNTVSYRLRRAEELRGRPLTEDRLHLELALLACHWLGSTVLTQTPPA